MPHLITVTGARIPLRPGQSCVIGRGKECDVVLEDSACSRLHARVSIGISRDVAFVEDLESRNGTFLNGDPVEGRMPVPGGARIRVGTTILMVELKEETVEFNLEETFPDVLTSPSPGGEVDGGELAAVGLVEILESLMAAGRSVSLHVALPKASAIVEVREGRVVAARHGHLEGFNALVRLGRAKSGIFWIVENAAACARTVREPADHLLVELNRCLDPTVAR